VCYNLLDEPWIPVIWRERPKQLVESWSDGPARGRSREKRIDDWRSEIGILDALNCAGQIREIYDTSPLVTLALNRLLLSLHCASLKEANVEAFCDGLRAFCDLWSTEAPFLQDKDSEFVDGEGDVPIAALHAELVRGTIIAHFAHCSDSRFWLDQASCARGLVVQRLFPTFGRSSDPHGALKRPLLYLPAGRSLADSLRIGISLLGDTADSLGKPNNPLLGSMKGLFWQYRRWRLIRNQDGTSRTTKHERCKPATPPQVPNDPHASPLVDRGQEQASRVQPPQPDTPLPLNSEWRAAINDIVGIRGHPVRSALSAEMCRQVHVILFPSDKWKFFHTGMLTLPAIYLRRLIGLPAPNQERLLAMLEEGRGKKRSYREPLPVEFDREKKPLKWHWIAGFEPGHFENVLSDLLQKYNGLGGSGVVSAAFESAGTVIERKRDGLPWRDAGDARPRTTGRPQDDDAKGFLKRFLYRLADKKRVPLSDLALLRRAKVHADLDAAPLTDLLNEHVREFKGLRRRTAWIIARLFAHDLERGHCGNMGQHLRSLRWAVSGKSRERLEREFEHLLYTPFDLLEAVLARWIMRLRQARRSNPQKHRRIHWEQLYQDLDGWGQEVRARWRAAFR